MTQSTPDDASPQNGEKHSEPPPTMMEVDVPGTPGDNREQRLDDTIVDGATSMSPDAVPTPAEMPAGTTLGKYEIRRRLGVGGMGEVYVAFDPMLDREVALKVLLPDVAARPQLLERFIREARAIGRLSHPHVVAVHDIGEAGDRHYIVMELLGGGSVHDLIRRSAPVPWKTACEMIADAAEGLGAAHAAGLIHRDIKPENLMLSSDRSVKIVDFGLAKSHTSHANDDQSTVSRVGQVMGTPQFMSPEQFSGLKVDHRCDIYGLGGALYQLLTGQFPFGDAETVVQLMYAHLEQPPPDPCLIRSDIPRRCAEVIARAMAKKPEERYQSGHEFAVELRTIADEVADDAPVLPPAPLRNVCIVEPSRMQAQVLKKQLSQCGSAAIQIQTDAESCRDSDMSEIDLLITAMQLPGLTGAELIRAVVDDRLKHNGTILLRSDHVLLTEIVTPPGRLPIGIVARSSRPVDLVHAVAAMSNLELNPQNGATEVDRMNIRTLVCCTGDSLPQELANVIRTSELLDTQIRTNCGASDGFADSDVFDVRIMALTEDADRGDQLVSSFSAWEKKARGCSGGVSALVQAHENQLVLRGLCGPQLQAATCCHFDASRVDQILRLASCQ